MSAITLASKIEFKKVCNILNEITSSPSSKRLQILKKFIAECRDMGIRLKTENPDADVSMFPLLRLFLPHLERERGPTNLKEKLLGNLYIRIFCIGKGSKDANKLTNYRVPTTEKCIESDFAERVYWVLRNRLSPNNTTLTVEQINTFLDEISKKNGVNHKKDEVFKVLLQHINAMELKWITRIILKNLKLGIGQQKILQAYHSEANSLFGVTSNLREICDNLYNPKTKLQQTIQIFSHFKPMLLERCKIEDVQKLFENNEQYFVQTKFDGERSQIHMKHGTFKYLTRRGFDISNNPGYGETSDSDGELMGWNKQKKKFGSKGMNFDVKKLLNNSSHQPCFVAFDIIMYNDDLLVDKPYKDRLEILKNAFQEEEGSLIRCDSEIVWNSQHLLKIFNKSLENNDEGIVVKKADMTYKPNARDGNCYKIKAEFSEGLIKDLDLIILGGYYGEGKFTGLIKSFMMGVATSCNIEGENPSQFFSVVSVSNGIGMDTLKKLQLKLNKYWIKNSPSNVVGPKVEPPDLWIDPEHSLILTIRATEMIQSSMYPVGYSLRFPRIVQVREDKPWYTACTDAELLSLIKNTDMVQKLTKRKATSDDIKNKADSKLVKISKSYTSVFERMSESSRVLSARTHIVPLTRLMDRKEICVVNGDDELLKEQIEDKLLLHRAKIVQNPDSRNETFCVIVGNVKKAKSWNILQSKKYDVVTMDWFKRVTLEENWSSLKDFLPWEMLCIRDSTKQRLAEKYDEYYDSFTINADEESLKRSLKKAQEMIGDDELTVIQENKMDKRLFKDEISPFSLFRGIIGYFQDPSPNTKLEFCFMAGTIKEELDESVTYIFVQKNSGKTSEGCINFDIVKQGLVKVVNDKWITDCFLQQKVKPIVDYLIE